MKITFDDTSFTTGRPGVEVTFTPDPVDSRGVNRPDRYAKIADVGAVLLPDGAHFVSAGRGLIRWHVNEAHYASAKEYADALQERVTAALDAYEQFDRFHRVRLQEPHPQERK